ncbi:MAG: ATP synthase subunit G atp20 [Phylliscum demangeonii]|nr:MAG: ATP synthase subunit G atp20 [Phylliscum demangeonii]
MLQSIARAGLGRRRPTQRLLLLLRSGAPHHPASKSMATAAATAPTTTTTTTAATSAATTAAAAATTAAQAAHASSAASAASSKAATGLSRVTSAAGPIAARLAGGATNALRGIGGRTGRLVAFVETLIPPTLYYSKVGWELAQMVFQAQRMNPPSLSAFQASFDPLLQSLRHSLRHPATLAGDAVALMRRARAGVSRQRLVVAAVVAAEVLGFFTVGEMIGRFKVVGYRGKEVEKGGALM